MKRRIVIALFVLALLVGVGLSLYFLFKKNTLSEEQAKNLIIRAAIDMEIIDDYEGSPDLIEFKTGTGEKNIINTKSLPSISEISLTSEGLTGELGIDEINSIIGLCLDILDIEGLQQNQVYDLEIDGVNRKVAYKLVENEIVFAYNIDGNINIISFFYDSIDNEYEFISVENTSPEGGFESYFKRIKGNAEGLLSYEEYQLSGIVGDNVLEKIEAGEGTTRILNIDYKNSTQKSAEYNKTINPDDHFVASSYVYQVYTNYDTSLEDLKNLILDAID